MQPQRHTELHDCVPINICIGTCQEHMLGEHNVAYSHFMGQVDTGPLLYMRSYRYLNMKTVATFTILLSLRSGHPRSATAKNQTFIDSVHI